MAIDKRLQVFDSEGNPVDYDILASDVKLSDGKDLPTRLGELEEEIGEGGYTPPQGGIPATDLAPAVQTSLGKADSAYQKPASGIPASDLATGVIPDVSNLATKSEVNAKANAADVYTKSQTNAAIQEAVNGIIAGDTHVVSLDEVEVVDEHGSNSSLAAGSARDVRELYLNLQALINSLAGIAFTNGKPNWITVAKPTYTLAYGTLSGCTADVDAGTVNEGYLKIILTPTNASDAFTYITVNGESVTATPVEGASNGSVFIEITVNQDITVAATASEGKNIDFTGSSNCQINKQSVANNTDLSATISANQHYTLPDTITVKVGTSTLSTSNYTYTRSADNKTATLLIDKQYITDDITIICTAVVMGSISVAFSGTNVAWTDDNGDAVTSPLTLYVDDRPYTLHCHPTSDNAMGQEPSITTGTATNSWTPDGNGYKLVIAAADTDDLTFTASAGPAHAVNVVVKKITAIAYNTSSYNALKNPSGASQEPYFRSETATDTGCGVSGAAPVADGGTYNGAVQMGSGYGLYKMVVKVGSTDKTSTAVDKVAKTIELSNVDDDVTIELYVRETVNGLFSGTSYNIKRDSGSNIGGDLVITTGWCCPPDVVKIPNGATKIKWYFGGEAGAIIAAQESNLNKCCPCVQGDYSGKGGYTRGGDGTATYRELDAASYSTGLMRASFIEASSGVTTGKLEYSIDGTNFLELWPNFVEPNND